MQEATTKNNIHLIYGILFTVIALVALIALVVVRSGADNANQNANISNATPVVNTVITTETSGGADDSDGIAMSVDGATKTVYVRGAATDDNGCTQINAANGAWTAKMYNGGGSNTGSGTTCSTAADNNDCYQVGESVLVLTNCTAPSGTTNDTTVDYEFTFTLQHWADATDTGSNYAASTWTSQVNVTDSGGAASTAATDTFEVSSANSLDVATSFSYGSMSLAEVTSSAPALTVTNTSNRSIDLDINADGDMACTGTGSANIPVASGRYAVSTGALAFASMTPLSTSASEVEISIARRTSEVSSSAKNLFWKLTVPTTGVAGTCTNILTLTSKTDESP